MAKTLMEARIAGRAERKRLPPGVHWRGIDPDVHLGYRRGKRGGVWLVRWYDGARYQQQTFGTADDELREGTLDYSSAVKAARDLVEGRRRRAKASAEGPALSIRLAVESYVAMRDARASRRAGRDCRSDAASRLGRYVIGHPRRGNRKAVPAAPLADVALHELTEKDLTEWQSSLPVTLRSTTRHRLINDLKAALNGACLSHRQKLPADLATTIKYGLRSAAEGGDAAADVARDNQILSDADIARIVSGAQRVDEEQGWEGDLFRLVLVLAATGARFSQVARIRVADVQADAGRIMIPISRKGRGSKSSSVPFPVGPDVLEALLPAVKGRAPEAILLERWRREQAAGSIRWERASRGAWHASSELSRPWAAIRAQAGMPNIIPYALRHSSIMRGIRSNLPARLVAALHDTSVVMIERHYGRYIADGLDELAARCVVALVPAAQSVGAGGVVSALPQAEVPA